MEFEYRIWNSDLTFKYKPYKFKKTNDEGLQGCFNLHRFLNQVRKIYKDNNWEYEDWLDEFYQSQFELNY